MSGELTLREWEEVDSARARAYERYMVARQFVGGPTSFAEQIWREGHIEDTNEPPGQADAE